MKNKQPADQTIKNDLELFGATDEDIEKLTTDTRDSFLLWKAHYQVFDLFLLCGTQWRTAGMGGQILGFDYPAVKIVCEVHEIEFTADLLTNLQVMEMAAVEHFAEQNKQ